LYRAPLLPTPLQCSVAETSGIGAEKEKIITEFIISISQLDFKICKINKKIYWNINKLLF